MIAKEDDIFRKNVCRLVSFVYKKANMKNLIVGVSEGVFIDVEVFPNLRWRKHPLVSAIFQASASLISL